MIKSISRYVDPRANTTVVTIQYDDKPVKQYRFTPEQLKENTLEELLEIEMIEEVKPR